MESLRSALDVLTHWQLHPWRDVCTVVGDATPLIWHEMERREIWADLDECDQAAVYWALAKGRVLRQASERFTTPDRHSRKLMNLCVELRYFAALCSPDEVERWPKTSTSRLAHARHPSTYRDLFTGMPTPWQAETLRLMDWPANGRDSGRLRLLDALETSMDAWKMRDEDPPAVTDRAQEEHRKVCTDLVPRFHRLPTGWQSEVLRHIDARERPLDAISDAQQAINIIRVYGIHLANSAPQCA
ncbi:hypothetical protein BGM09_10270 [Streptomyces sp. CBMA29]|nr:hypothetical protein [Streptomyces sp. CBMA29]